MKLLLMKAIKLLYGYNQTVKTDPQYKLDKPYSPKTDIDMFFESYPEVSTLVKQMIKDGDIIRKSKLESFGDYEKEEYSVELLNGEVVVCYPNAQCMHSLDGSDRVFEPLEVFSFKII